MKRTLKRFSAIACFTLIAFTSCYLPGSDQYKIKSATADYVSARLNKGEKYHGDTLSERMVAIMMVKIASMLRFTMWLLQNQARNWRRNFIS